MSAPAFTLPPSLDLAAAFAERPRMPEFVLPGLLPGTVGALVAPGATGKSLWSLQVAIAVAGGGDMLGLGIERHGPVMLVAAEDPEVILGCRLHDISSHLSPDGREAALERLDIMPAYALGIDLFGSGAGAWEQAIIERGRGCRLIIIDTLSRVHSGDESARSDAATVMRRLERIAAETGAAVIFLHHIAKAVALVGLGDQQQAGRGSSVWIDEARWAGFLKTMDEKEAGVMDVDADMRRNFVRFGISKVNYTPPALDVWLRREGGGVLVPAVMPSAARIAKAKAKAKAKEIDDEKW